MVEPVRYTRETGRYTPISGKKHLKYRCQIARGAARRNVLYFSGRSRTNGLPAAAVRPPLWYQHINNSVFIAPGERRGLASVTGSGTATVQLESGHADCVFVIGGNPASNHPANAYATPCSRRAWSGHRHNPIVETGLVRSTCE